MPIIPGDYHGDEDEIDAEYEASVHEYYIYITDGSLTYTESNSYTH